MPEFDWKEEKQIWDDLAEEARNERGTTLCPNCRGLSPTVEAMDAQLAAVGDPSGACGTCNNTHEVPLNKT